MEAAIKQSKQSFKHKQTHTSKTCTLLRRSSLARWRQLSSKQLLIHKPTQAYLRPLMRRSSLARWRQLSNRVWPSTRPLLPKPLQCWSRHTARYDAYVACVPFSSLMSLWVTQLSVLMAMRPCYQSHCNAGAGAHPGRTRMLRACPFLSLSVN